METASSGRLRVAPENREPTRRLLQGTSCTKRRQAIYCNRGVVTDKDRFGLNTLTVTGEAVSAEEAAATFLVGGAEEIE